MRKLLMSLPVLAGSVLGAVTFTPSAEAAPTAVALPLVYTGSAPQVQTVQYYEGWHHHEWRRREAYERWRRHEEWRRWHHYRNW